MPGRAKATPKKLATEEDKKTAEEHGTTVALAVTEAPPSSDDDVEMEEERDDDQEDEEETSKNTTGDVKKVRKIPKVAGKNTTIRKKHRWRAGTVALREIRAQQKRTDLQIPKAPISRLIRQIAGGYHADDLRFGRDAFTALREAAEAFLIERFEDANALAIHCKRVTIFPSDMTIAGQINHRN